MGQNECLSVAIVGDGVEVGGWESRSGQMPIQRSMKLGQFEEEHVLHLIHVSSPLLCLLCALLRSVDSGLQRFRLCLRGVSSALCHAVC